MRALSLLRVIGSISEQALAAHKRDCFQALMIVADRACSSIKTLNKTDTLDVYDIARDGVIFKQADGD